MSKLRKQIILGAYLGGVNHHAIWSDPAAGSQIGFSSLRYLAQTAERGKFEFIGTPRQVADRIDSFVQNDGSDGFIIGSHPTPTGLDEFVDRVVPLLQERGSLRDGYTGTTLRDNLGIPVTGPAVSAMVA